MLISREGRRYRTEVIALLAVERTRSLAGRLRVRICIHPPDRRAFDLDNRLKGLLDALALAGVYRDDGQIDELSIKRGPVSPGGKAIVEVMEITPSAVETLPT